MNAHRPQITTRTYLLVWAALLVLLFLTWAVAQMDLGDWNIVAAMTVAVTKMVLVILYFMHVRHSSRVTRLFVASGFFWLLILMSLTLADYLTRTR